MTTTLSIRTYASVKRMVAAIATLFSNCFTKSSGTIAVFLLLTATAFGQAATYTFAYSGSIVNFTVPQGVTKIRIVAKGAQGGSTIGGLGASMQGDFVVTPGQVLKILVGQQGGVLTNNSGGGGGTFVTDNTNTPLLIAGGGGGGVCGKNGLPGLATPNGTNGGGVNKKTNDGGGGSNGGGGGGSGDDYGGASGGAGLLGNGGSGGSISGFFCWGIGGAGGNGTNGGNATGSYCTLYNVTVSPKSYITGGQTGNYGGFGGGGGVNGVYSCYTGGGGGGYSGGGAGYSNPGGGGGSYNNGTNQVNASGAQTGNGVVTITTFPPGAAINLDGVDDYLRTSNPFYQFTNAITVEAWINTTQSVWMGQSTPDVDNWASSNVWLWHIKGPGQGMDWIINDGGTPRGISLNTLSPGWHHIATTANACGMFIYVDGVLVVSSSTGIGSGIKNVATSVFDIGKDPRYSNVVSTGTDRYTSFSADEVRVWNRSLSKQEINAHKSCELAAGQMNGLQQYYQFNQGLAGDDNTAITTVTDASGNGRNAVINNLAKTGATSNFITSGGVITGVSCTPFTLAAITGNAPVGVGGTLLLANATAGGAWSSSAPGVATVNTSGLVTALSAGTTVISYTIDCGTSVTATVTVYAPATGLSFDGSNDYVAVNTPFTAFNKEITVEFWMYTPSAIMPFGSVMGQGTSNVDDWTSANVWLMHPNTNGTMSFHVNDDGNARSAQFNIIGGSWHHYAAVASATSTKVYVDGVLVQTGPGVSGTIMNNSNSVIHIGKDVRYNIGKPFDVPRYGTMTIDEVRIWNRALCQAEILNNKNGEINPASQNGLQQYYRFNQGLAGTDNTTITSLTDLSGNNRNGALTNFAFNGTSSNWTVSGSVNTGIVPAFVAPTAPITGAAAICTGTSTTLANANAGGVWTSSNTTVATIHAATGVVNALAAGNTTITYKTECGAVSTLMFTVNPVPVVTIAAVGGTTTCPGSSVTLNATAPAGSTYQWCKDGVAIAGAVNASYNASASGSYTAVVVSNGCTSAASNAVSITVSDVSAPAFTAPYQIITPTSPDGSIAATSLNGAVVTFQLPVASDNCPSPVSVTATPASGSVFPIGSTTVQVSAVDNAGNTATTSFVITVSGLPPAIVCPANITVSNDPGQCGAKVNFAATETTGVPASTITYSVPSGTVFPVGTTVVTATATNSLGSSTCEFTITVTAPDADSDGVPDACDADADNDGILNVSECNKSNFFWSTPPGISGKTATGTINGIAYTYTSTSPVTTTTYMYGNNVFPASYGVPNANPTIQNLAVTNNTLTFASPMTNPVLVFASIGNSSMPVPISFGAPVQVIWSQNVVVNSSTRITGTEGYAIVRMMGTFSSISFNYLAAENWCNFAFGADFQTCGDTDNDGIPDYLDTDSDGDGCPDAIEGSMSFPINQTRAGRLTGGVDSQGIPLLAGAGQGIGTSQNYVLNCFCQPGLDETAPNVITKNITINLNAAGTATIVPAQVNNGSTDACGIAAMTLSKTSFSCGDIGANTVTLTVTDNDGNAASATAIVTVVDNIAPAITCPANISVLATSPNGAVVNYMAPIGTDNCSGATTVRTAGPASGATFPIGTTVVTHTVTDGSGLTATCSFTVTVTGLAPVIVCPADKTVNNEAGQCGAVVNFAATETTAIPAATISYTENGQPVTSGSFFTAGTHTITAIATNSVGTASCNFTIIVKDTEVPTVFTNAVTVNVSAAGTASVTASQVNNGSADNCGIASYSLDKTTFNCSNVGANTVTLTVTDIHGNSSSATAVVTVKDILAPVPVVSTLPVITAQCGITLTAPKAVDNCAGTVTATTTSPLSYTTQGTYTVNWIYGDGNGNSSSQQQTVIIRDNTVPVALTQNITVPLDASGHVTVTPAQVNNGSADNCSAVNLAFATGITTGTICATVTEGGTLVLTAPAGAVITGINFASYGTPNGSCGNFTLGGCHAAGSKAIVENYALGKNSVSIPASNGVFGDPCYGTLKRLYVEATYLLTAGNASIASSVNFDCSNVGNNTVSLLVTDASGNQSVKQAIITVKDVTAPVAVTQNITVPLSAEGTASITAADINNGSTDVCGIQSMSVSQNNFTCTNTGANTVTLTVTDMNGNVSTATAMVTIVDQVAPTVITQNITIPLSASGTASVTASQLNNGSTDNCGIASYSLDKTGFDCSNVGVNTVTLTVTDVNGNSAVQTATVTVMDNMAPVVTVPAAQVFCANANGSNQYTILAASATDNCSVATVSYAITGATSRTGNGYDGSGSFAIGTSTITWTVTDVNGNSTRTSSTVVVNPLPVATYASSNADAFCNQTTLTGSSNIEPALYSWSNSNTPGAFSVNPLLQLGLTSADGNYYLYTQSSVTGCVSAAAAVYNYQKQNLSSSYTILAYKEAELGKYNKVLSGSVGIMSAKGEAAFKSHSGVTGAGSFVKAPEIDKDGSGIILNSQIIGVASVTLPSMQYNTASTNSLPSYTASQNNATLSANYKNLVVKKGISVTVTGNTFGNIRLEEGASIRFTSSVLNIGNFTADRGARNQQYTYIRFAQNSSVRIGNKVSLGSQVQLNPDNYKVSFYMADDRKDEEKFTVKGGDTRVIANILMPNGKLRVTATDSDKDDQDDCDHRAHNSKDCKHRGHDHNDCDHRGHAASNCQDDVYMTGLFIAEKVESKGNKVIWNSYDCNATAPVTSVNSVPAVVTQAVSESKAVTAEAATEEELKVTVMPNPSTTYFTLKLESKYETPVNLRVMDGSGRVVDARSKLGANSTIQIGHHYSSGTYYAELIQGTRRKVVQLIKARG